MVIENCAFSEALYHFMLIPIFFFLSIPYLRTDAVWVDWGKIRGLSDLMDHLGFAELLAGKILVGFKMINGSGPGPFNHLTPKQMIKILYYADSKFFAEKRKQPFSTLRPISGVKGSLLNRMSDPDL